MVSLSYRAKALWLLGYPEVALADVDHALKDAREIDQAATLMFALARAAWTNIVCGNYTAAIAEAAELVALADVTTSLFWKAAGMLNQGCILILTEKASDAVQMMISGIAAYRSTGATLSGPWHLQYLAMAYAELGQ